MVAEFSFTERARPIVQIGVGDSRIASIGGQWGAARWGVGLWAGNDPAWLDRTGDVISIDISGGRLRASDRFDSATCTLVVDNTSGWADQAVDPDAVLALRPGRPLRVGIDHVVYGRIWRFWGVIDQLDPTYIAHAADEAVIVAVDMLADVNRTKVTLNAAPYPTERAGERVVRLLTSVPIPAERVQADDTSVTITGGRFQGQIADLVNQAAESAGGVVFGAPDGIIRFRARDWQDYDPAIGPDAVVGNVTTAALRFSGLPGTYLSAPMVAAPATNHVELVARVALDNWNAAPIGTTGGIVQAGSIAMRMLGGHTVQVSGVKGAATPAVSGVLPALPAGSFVWLRGQVTPSAITVEWAPDAADVPTVWTALGSTALAGGIDAAAAGTVLVGRDTAAPSVYGPGYISRARLIRAGVTILDLSDADAVAADDAGRFNASSGQLVTSHGVVVVKSSTDVVPVSWDRPFNRADIATRVLLSRQDNGDVVHRFDDSGAQIRYGVEPFERTNLLTERDVDLDELGNRWLVTRGEGTAPRIRSVSFDASTADNVVDLVTTISPYTPSRYRCRLQLPRGVVFDRQHFVTRTRHLITRDQWLVDATLDVADTFAHPGARWGRSLWGAGRWAG